MFRRFQSHCLTAIVSYIVSSDAAKVLYSAVVVDTGSSGSRIEAFFVRTPPNTVVGLPGIRIQASLHLVAGNGDELMKSAVMIAGGIETQIAALFKFSGTEERMPVFMYATAGLRSIGEEAADSLLREVAGKVGDILDHRIESVTHKVISGRQEGLYSLLALSLLLNGGTVTLDRAWRDRIESMSKTVFVIDMGGKSMEVCSAGPDEVLQTEDDLVDVYENGGADALYREYLELSVGAGPCAFGTGTLADCLKTTDSLVATLSLQKRNIQSDSIVVGKSSLAYLTYFIRWLRWYLSQTNSMHCRMDHLHSRCTSPALNYKSPPEIRTREFLDACTLMVELPEAPSGLLGSTYAPTLSKLESRPFLACTTYSILRSLGVTSIVIMETPLDSLSHTDSWTLGAYVESLLKRVGGDSS